MKKIYLFIIATVIGSSWSFSQDFHLSQYDAASLNTNPAMTGAFDGSFRIHGHYRTQWAALVSRPFQTALLAADFNLPKNFAIGIQLADFNAGTAGYNVLAGSVSLSYNIFLSKNKFHQLRFGVQPGFFQKRINRDHLTWGSQYVPTASGGTFDTGISSGETFADQQMFNFDLNAGFLYTYSNPGSRINPFVGLTVFHLNAPNESFFANKENRLPFRYLAHLGVRIGINEKYSIIPKIYYTHQKAANEMTFSLDNQFYLSTPDLYLLAGITYRSEDALIIGVGAKYAGFTFRFSYDTNLSSLTSVSNGRGATELSLTYVFKKPKSNPVETCPRL